MKKVFLDANVFFAATLSQTGASRAIFLLAKSKKVKIISSWYALDEARRNLEKKIGFEHIPTFLNLSSELIVVDKEACEDLLYFEKYKEIIVRKDIPILYSVEKMKVDILITLDKKDFMNERIKSVKFPFLILTPGEFLSTLL